MMDTEVTRPLRVFDHDRDSAGLLYVYPVVSRRSGGISIGINFNPNNACNWRCLYCQVPELKRGTAPVLDKARLRQELAGLLEQIVNGGFYRQFDIPPRYRRLRDIAISGNGEPTTLKDFDAAVFTIEEVLDGLNYTLDIAKVIITNGSMIHRPTVQAGLSRWGKLGGEIWFKLDRATPAGLKEINGAAISPSQVMANLATAAHLCPVRIQTCLFALDGQPPPLEECQAYLDFLATALQRDIPLQEVLLYGLARPSMQPEAALMGTVPTAWMEDFAAKIRSLGLPVRVTP